MRELTIYRRFFTESDCFKAAKRHTSVGIQVHSTGANNPYLKRYVQPDDGRLGKNEYKNSHNRPGVNVCASAYIGKLKDGTVAVYQTLPWDYRCWLSASGRNGSANRIGYVGFEICEDSKSDEDYFKKAVIGAAVNLTAHLCSLFETTPDAITQSFKEGSALVVLDHSELHDVGLASNHGDITHWLRCYGYNMDTFRSAVQSVMDEGIRVTYVDCDKESEVDEVPMSGEKEIWSENGGWVNLRSSYTKNSDSLARLYPGTVVSLTSRRLDGWCGVVFEGVAGYVMEDFLRDIKDPESNSVDDFVLVNRAELRVIYDAFGAMLEG